MNEYKVIEITKGTEKQINFAKKIQARFFDDLEDYTDFDTDVKENVEMFLRRLGDDAAKWLNAVHKYGIGAYSVNKSSFEQLTTKLNIARV